MSLTRGYSPAQFRDLFLGAVGPTQVSATIASTAAGASTTINVAVPGAAVGDMVLIGPAVAPTAGCSIVGSVVSAGNVSVNTSVATGGATYAPGAQLLTFVLLRPRTA